MLTPGEWTELRRAVEAGITRREAAKLWNVAYEAVRKRSQREQWLVPSQVKLMAAHVAQQESLKIENARQSQVVPSSPGGADLRPSASLAVAKSFLDYKSGTLLALAKSLRNGLSAETVQNMVPENVSEMVQMGNLALKLYNVGGEGSQVNILVGDSSSFGGPVVETGDAIEMEDELDD